MCGIFGIVTNRAVEASALEKAGKILSHRGPDDSGIWISKNSHAGLGHQRLSIIDLSGNAHQPMSNEACPECRRRNGSAWITYNGEVYNYREIREALDGKGHDFKSLSDTEVILHAYEEWGEGCLDRLSGMFAFAIWDGKKQKLFLARDRIGKKPLFYYRDSKTFAFASEIQALLALNIPKSINLSAVHQYLTYQYFPAPKSIFKNVFKLPPAHYLILENGVLKIQRYWDINFSKKISVISEKELAEEVYEKLKESVSQRLISDVPLGAFLSGGIDSSIVVALMSQIMKEPVKTFSIGFEEEAYNELPYARQIAKLFKTKHKEFIVRFDALNILPKLVRHYGEPFADSSALPTYYLSKMTSEFVTVALSGDGGDENFAGYDRYFALKIIRGFKGVPEIFRRSILNLVKTFPEHDGKGYVKRFKRFLEGSLAPDGHEYLQWVIGFSSGDAGNLYTPFMQDELKNEDPYDYLTGLFRNSTAFNPAEKSMDADIHSYLPFDLLVKVDIASMANSLEIRCPFLDHRFMEFIATIPLEYKLKGRIKKYILKKAFNGLIPEAIFKRRKAGFGVPLYRWLRHELKDYISEILLSRQSVERSYFKPDAVKILLSEHISGRIDHSTKLWTLLMLELWHREFIDNN
ncbi:MAG: asparagine synthase (glutamine-hydrolyzing) [Nitrospirae bacterium]|nr:asparagine synthase (glutamine-hydrolyzing) [Nitrospirota bacterium]